MSLSFHDLFPGEDGEPGGGVEADEVRSGLSNQPKSTMDENRAVFSKPPSSRDFAEEQGRSFLVSELLPFIPPAISAQSGIPMELEVSIPMPSDGSSEVKLSTVYQACPDLFAAEITPLNDSVVTLPVKLGGFSPEAEFTASPFTPGKAFGTKESAAPELPNESSADNPFWSPTAEQGSDPDRPGMELPAEEAQDDFSAAEPESPKSDSHEPVGGFDEPYSPSSEKAAPPSEPDPVALGFSGKPFGSDESFFTLFSNRDDAEEGESSSGEASPAPSSNWGSMFQPPEQEDVKSETIAEPVHEESAEEELEVEPVTPAADFEETVEEIEKEEPPIPMGFELPSFEPPAVEPEPEPEPDPDPELKSVEPVAEEARDEKVENPKPTIEWKKLPTPERVAAETPSPVQISPPVPAEEEALPQQPVQPKELVQPPGPVQPAPAAVNDDLFDVELRAIFSTSDRFTLAKLARKVVVLPGIAACAISGAGKVVQATKSEENQLGADAHDMVDAVRNIAKLTGMDKAKSFTMKTEFGIVSLFLEGDCCLSVNHGEGEFGPGVREKLIVIARSLHKLTD